jgi:hypothetical protein
MLNLYEFEAPTMLTVQAAALMAIFEMSIDKESTGWVYCSMATAMAFNLGLHIDCSSAVEDGVIDGEEAEARNITWWGCYMLNRYEAS